MESISLFSVGTPAPVQSRFDQPADAPDPKQQRQPDSADTVEISAGARQAARQDHQQNSDKTHPATATEFSSDERQQLEQLQQRDREVRAHENAHRSAAGGLVVAGPIYNFQRGPDGKAYAVGGEVRINTAKGHSPEQTIRSARQAQQAALAPKQPSSQDRAVAARAGQRIQQAQIELAQLKAADTTSRTDKPSEPSQSSQSDQTEPLEPNKQPISTAQSVPDDPSIPAEQSIPGKQSIQAEQSIKEPKSSNTAFASSTSLENSHQHQIQQGLDVVT